MININSLHFSNMLSYGEDNLIRFNTPVTQLVGKNGAGKSAIPTILEEVLFNKNSKGIKKGDILHKFNGAVSYKASVQFDVGLDHYFLEKEVTSVTKVKLYKNDDNISGHTTTQTYKQVELILGISFPTFSKLVYQSMVSSLDFISATDSNRKKFLISLLGLEDYVDKESLLKEKLKTQKTEVASLEGSLTTLKSIVESSSTTGTPVIVPELILPDTSALEEYRANKVAELSNIDSKNKIISTNVTAKKELDNLAVVKAPHILVKGVVDLVAEQRRGRELTVLNSEYRKLDKVKDTCPTCNQSVDISDTLDRLALLENKIKSLNLELTPIAISNNKVEKDNAEITKYESYAKELGKLTARYDSTIDTDLVTADDLKSRISELTASIATSKATYASDKIKVDEAIKHNAATEVRIKQLTDANSKLVAAEEAFIEAHTLQDRLATLKMSFGTKGLIAFKIESLVKVFEELINQYLQELSDGDFTLKFIMDDTKLQIKIRSGSVEMDVKLLSSGEFNKVNTATLLAVRKMLTAISKVDIDVLFLDEVVSVLDPESKDTLIELLLKEQDLNTIIVSHGYTHPLASRMLITKENRVSRIDIDEQ